MFLCLFLPQCVQVSTAEKYQNQHSFPISYYLKTHNQDIRQWLKLPPLASCVIIFCLLDFTIELHQRSKLLRQKSRLCLSAQKWLMRPLHSQTSCDSVWTISCSEKRRFRRIYQVGRAAGVEAPSKGRRTELLCPRLAKAYKPNSSRSIWFNHLQLKCSKS